MNTQDVTDLMSVITANWPNYKPSVATLVIAEQMLADIEPEFAAVAVLQLAVDHPEFAPGPGLIRARALEVKGVSVGDVDEAWGQVRAAIAHYGYLRQPWFADPAVTAAVDAFGWQELCASTNIEATRAHFFRIYESVARRGRRQATQPPAAAELLEKVSARLALGRAE